MGSKTNKIKAVTKIKEFQGQKTIGILFVNSETWYNVYGSNEVLQEMLKILKKGNVISYDYVDGQLQNISLISEAEPEPEQEKSNKKEKWQDDMVDFKRLLDQAHKQGLISIETECLSVDLEKKYALFKATVKGKSLQDKKTHVTCQGHGDATHENISGDYIRPHFIRMAETRAIVRALRWFTNNAEAAEEEK